MVTILILVSNSCSGNIVVVVDAFIGLIIRLISSSSPETSSQCYTTINSCGFCPNNFKQNITENVGNINCNNVNEPKSGSSNINTLASLIPIKLIKRSYRIFTSSIGKPCNRVISKRFSIIVNCEKNPSVTLPDVGNRMVAIVSNRDVLPVCFEPIIANICPLSIRKFNDSNRILSDDCCLLVIPSQ
ncbi:hypothetical protein DERP_005940 [Dermatophagoides pteronyssinus]|uniref:Uncharacterized protein n=1 Tax=Dermatophagoides pteronyssinus TaxID=6956 RepID=A0ABQ8JSG2_DERPT|nr:hypothetical protein DERP_005940 [Dermatophagoides pteronyssinus]